MKKLGMKIGSMILKWMSWTQPVASLIAVVSSSLPSHFQLGFCHTASYGIILGMYWKSRLDRQAYDLLAIRKSV